MYVFSLTIILVALCSGGISALKNITITAQSDLRPEFNQFKSKSDAKFLVFDHVIVESIAEDAFNDYKNLQLIYFKRNGITEIAENLFKYNTEIRFVTIKDNLFTTLHSNTFAAMKKMVGLTLSHNRLEDIDEMLFANNGKLIALGLQNNVITTIRPKTFEKLVNLKMLYLSNNQIDSLPENVFANNRKLVDLYLHNNNLRVLSSPALLANNPELSHLFLGENLLQRFDFSILQANSKLEDLDMERNELFELANYEQTSQLLPKLENIDLLVNYFNCSFYAKVNAHFAASNVSLEASFNPTSVIRGYETEPPPNCIPDEGYGKELAEKLNKSYNKLNMLEETIEDAKKSLYSEDSPTYNPKTITRKFYSMLQDVDDCVNGVEGYKSMIMESCDSY